MREFGSDTLRQPTEEELDRVVAAAEQENDSHILFSRLRNERVKGQMIKSIEMIYRMPPYSYSISKSRGIARKKYAEMMQTINDVELVTVVDQTLPPITRGLEQYPM